MVIQIIVIVIVVFFLFCAERMHSNWQISWLDTSTALLLINWMLHLCSLQTKILGTMSQKH